MELKTGNNSTLCLPSSYRATQVSLSTATARMVRTDPVRQVWARGSSQGTRWGNTCTRGLFEAGYSKIKDIINNYITSVVLTEEWPTKDEDILNNYLISSE